MFKSVYEFTKGFSILFLISGIFFLIREVYNLGFISMLSFFLIKFVDSDWAFDNFKFSNHNLVVILSTFMLIFVNSFVIYQEMRFSPLFTRITPEDKASYLIYEEALYSSISPCVTEHNKLMERMNTGTPIYAADVKKTNAHCYTVIEVIDKQVIPANFNPELKILCSDMQENFKRIAVSLATYSYSSEKPQESTVLKVKENLNQSLNSMLKVRDMMHMTEELSEEKRTFIKL